jgi:hypothetical protein
MPATLLFSHLIFPPQNATARKPSGSRSSSTRSSDGPKDPHKQQQPKSQQPQHPQQPQQPPGRGHQRQSELVRAGGISGQKIRRPGSSGSNDGEGGGASGPIRLRSSRSNSPQGRSMGPAPMLRKIGSGSLVSSMPMVKAERSNSSEALRKAARTFGITPPNSP